MVRRDFNRTPLGCYRVSRDCQGVWPARHGTVVNTPATRYVGRVTTRSVLSPVQEGFASIVLGECHLRRGSGGILRATRALPCPPWPPGSTPFSCQRDPGSGKGGGQEEGRGSCSREVPGSGWGPGGEAGAGLEGWRERGHGVPRDGANEQRAASSSHPLLCTRVKGRSSPRPQRSRCSRTEFPRSSPMGTTHTLSWGRHPPAKLLSALSTTHPLSRPT